MTKIVSVEQTSTRGDLNDNQNFLTRLELVTFFWTYKHKPNMTYKHKPNNPIRVMWVLG